MAPRKKIQPPTDESGLLEEIKAKREAEAPKPDEMPLESLGDYIRYNKAAREANKKLKYCRYVIKQCPVELHPKETIIFERVDQPGNKLKVFISNDMIEFKQELVPGQQYDLPRCVVEYLASKGTPIYKTIDKPDGTKQVVVAGKNSRFSLRTIYAA